MFHSWQNNQSTEESGLLLFPSEWSKNTKKNLRGEEDGLVTCILKQYPVQPDISRTSELKGEISKTEVCKSLLIIDSGNHISPTFSSSQVSVTFNKISFFFCSLHFFFVIDETDIIKSIRKKDRKIAERVRKQRPGASTYCPILGPPTLLCVGNSEVSFVPRTQIRNPDFQELKSWEKIQLLPAPNSRIRTEAKHCSLYIITF